MNHYGSWGYGAGLLIYLGGGIFLADGILFIAYIPAVGGFLGMTGAVF